ncbi:MAG: TIGR04222 domain-containing membrane protein [Planctomycetota bacterium]
MDFIFNASVTHFIVAFCVMTSLTILGTEVWRRFVLRSKQPGSELQPDAQTPTTPPKPAGTASLDLYQAAFLEEGIAGIIRALLTLLLAGNYAVVDRQGHLKPSTIHPDRPLPEHPITEAALDALPSAPKGPELVQVIRAHLPPVLSDLKKNGWAATAGHRLTIGLAALPAITLCATALYRVHLGNQRGEDTMLLSWLIVPLLLYSIMGQRPVYATKAGKRELAVLKRQIQRNAYEVRFNPSSQPESFTLGAVLFGSNFIQAETLSNSIKRFEKGGYSGKAVSVESGDAGCGGCGGCSSGCGD